MKVAICEVCGPLPQSPLWPVGTTAFNHNFGTGHKVRVVSAKRSGEPDSGRGQEEHRG